MNYRDLKENYEIACDERSNLQDFLRSMATFEHVTYGDLTVGDTLWDGGVPRLIESISVHARDVNTRVFHCGKHTITAKVTVKCVVMIMLNGVFVPRERREIEFVNQRT